MVDPVGPLMRAVTDRVPAAPVGSRVRVALRIVVEMGPGPALGPALVAVLERVTAPVVVAVLVASLCVAVRWHGSVREEAVAGPNGWVGYIPQG